MSSSGLVEHRPHAVSPEGRVTVRSCRGTRPYDRAMAVDRTRRARAARRRKHRMARVEHDLSVEQWQALSQAWGGCAYCGKSGEPLQRDCVLALSRGGRYTLANIAPACRSCNASKCNDEVTAWMRRKRLDERAFLLRHVEIQTELAQQFRAHPEAGAADPPEPTAG